MKQPGGTFVVADETPARGRSRLAEHGSFWDGRVVMNFFVEYFKLLDLLALAALAALACAALIRNRSVWLFVAGILAAGWGAMRVLGFP
jgi:hypothetical protein